MTNVFHSSIGPHVAPIADKLNNNIESPVNGIAGLRRLLEERSKLAWPTSHFEHLDLVGHAYDGPLRLGDNDPLTATAINQNLIGVQAAAAGFNDVRLLGCNTANLVDGQDAMRALHTALGVPVFGTDTKVDVADFEPDGFATPGILHPWDNPPLAKDERDSISEWKSQLSPFAGDLLKALREAPGGRASQSRRNPLKKGRRFVLPRPGLERLAERVEWAGVSRGLLKGTTAELVSFSDGRAQRHGLIGGGDALLVRARSTDDSGNYLIVMFLSHPLSIDELCRDYSPLCPL